VDGVSPGKPAEKAGFLAGDLVLKIGEFETNDIYKYMEALGKFEKGQKVTVELKRGGEVLKKDVEF
jgi:S1-C subfamily serine protease